MIDTKIKSLVRIVTKVHAISTKLRSQVKLPDRESAALANFTGDLRCIATFELWYYIRYRATFVEHRRNYDVKKSPDRGVTTNYPVDHAGSRYQRISTSPSRQRQISSDISTIFVDRGIMDDCEFIVRLKIRGIESSTVIRLNFFFFQDFK